MVYYGTPSRACKTCRNRRIGCDQQRPTCGQCTKSKRECLGYRDETDLMFVNWNESLKGKPRMKRSPARDREPASELIVTSPSILKQVSETTERQALSFFFTEFASPPRHRETARSFIEHFLPVYAEAKTGDPLIEATAATALATFSNNRKSHQLTIHSHTHYGRAAKTLQQAIVDPVQARRNETLMSIMVLGLFEAVTSSGPTFFEWGHHVDGALALVRWRGDEEMLANPLSCRLYWSALAQALSHQIIKCEALDPYLDWEALWKEPVIQKPPAIMLTILGSRIPALRAAAVKWYKAPISAEVAMKCVDIVANTKAVDRLLAGWALEVPSPLRPRVVGTVEGDLNPLESFLYPGELHSYSDLWVASMWNSWRSFRIICNALIVNGLERLVPPSELDEWPEFRCAVETVQTMADGFCASVPYHLGHPMADYELDQMRTLRGNDYPASDRYHDAQVFDKGSVVKTVGTYYLLMPFFLCNSAFTLSVRQRTWMRGRLVYVADRLRSNHARTLANRSPIAIEGKRTESLTDYLPPAYSPCPDMQDLMENLRLAPREERVATAESRWISSWRAEFVECLWERHSTFIATPAIRHVD